MTDLNKDALERAARELNAGELHHAYPLDTHRY